MNEFLTQNLKVLDHQFALQQALLELVTKQSLWYLVVVITLALAVAILNVLFWSWLIKTHRTEFGGEARNANPNYQLLFYTVLISSTILGALVCAGMVSIGVFMASIS